MIKAYEGQQVHNSLIDALVTQEIKRQHAAREKAEAEERKNRRRAIRLRYYGRNLRPPRPVRRLLGIYGLIILVITEARGTLHNILN